MPILSFLFILSCFAAHCAASLTSSAGVDTFNTEICATRLGVLTVVH